MDDIGFLDMMNVGSRDVNWEGSQYCSPIAEQETMSTPDVAGSAKQKSKGTRAPSTKGKNWSSHDDKLLIKAWANTSLDAVIGMDQNSSCYWNRSLAYYNMHKEPSWPERMLMQSIDVTPLFQHSRVNFVDAFSRY
uniref:Uncharacterized protein n=1 Tax=Avena sativa TaxID=4498 RepID=A0ACD5Z4A4_AVESA